MLSGAPTPSSLARVEMPGATTAVYFGGASAEARTALEGFRAVLWCRSGAVDAEEELGIRGRETVVRCAPGAEARLRDELLRFVRLDPRKLPSVFVAANEGEESERAQAPFVSLVTDELREQHRARVTRQQDGFRWQQHVLANLADYAQRPLPESWRGALAGLPAAVCGAGPSLDVSAARLAAGQEGCVVFAADSALRTLARHGVRVDFAVSIDVAKRPEKCLPESAAMPARVILSAVSPPDWARYVAPEKRCFVASRQITTDWLAQGGVAPPALAVAENCGVTALELARWLGCGPIHLFGLDLALSGRQRHTESADAGIYVRSGFNAAQEFPEVPGNWEPAVATHAPGDWRALNARLAAFPADMVFNVNDRGARLENARAVRPDEWMPPAPIDKAGRLARLEEARGAVNATTWPERLAELRRCGEQLTARRTELRMTLDRRGPEAAAMALRPLLADPAIGRALGGFALKVMPHLLPPTEGDAAFWRGLLDELEQLAQLLVAQR